MTCVKANGRRDGGKEGRMEAWRKRTRDGSTKGMRKELEKKGRRQPWKEGS